MKNYFTLILIILAYFVQSATFTTTSTPGVWDCAPCTPANPGSGDNIIVNHDWRNWNAPQISNYTGTLTVNNGGYYKINGSASTWTNAVINISNTGNLRITGAADLRSTLTMNNEGHFEVNGNLAIGAGVNFTGLGTYYVGGVISGSGSVGTNTLGVLPVDLISFTVTKMNENSVILNWVTASEINNDYFEIQKSDNGFDFYPISTVKGNGNSTVVNSYNFMDDINNSSTSFVYFRLKQIDYDLQFEYSPIVSIQTENSFSLIQFQNTPNFVLNTKNKGNYTVKIYASNGSLHSIYNFEMDEGSTQNFSVHHNGFYTAVVFDTKNIFTKKGVVYPY